MRAVKEQLLLMVAHDAPYLAMLRDWMRIAKERNEFARLIQFGIDPTELL
jgi:hypothetical protein